MTTIKLKNGSGAPAGGDLTQGEPALDLTNKRLYTENASGTVIEVGTNPTSITTGDITATGTVSFAGLGTTGDVTFGDNDKAIFGAGSDLEILSQGTDALIRNGNATAEMRIESDDRIVISDRGFNEAFAIFNDDDDVKLYHDGSLKLATTSTGIDVTGSVTADGGTFDGAVLMNSSNELQFFNTNYGIRASTGLEIKTGDFTRFLEGSTEHMRIASGGNVGIGTSSPSYVVHASTADNTIAQFQSTDNRGAILISDDDTNSYIGSEGGSTYISNSGGALSSGQLVIDSAGRVGIGLSNPTAPLTVNGNSNGLLAEFGGNNTVPARRLQLNEYAVSGINNSGFEFNAPGAGGAAAISFSTLGTEVARFDSSNNFLVGKTANDNTTAGFKVQSGGFFSAVADGTTTCVLNRLTSDGDIAIFRKDGTTVGSIGTAGGDLVIEATTLGIFKTAGSNSFGWNNSFIYPLVDNSKDLGTASFRFDDVYATNGTIQTSDRNEKQDIEALSDAEQRVAVAAKGLLRKFRWINSVEEKGDDARIHFGIIAQDLQDAFTAEGLDAGRYAMFINSTWTDEETGEERSRMGVRYSELLAFIISAI